MTKEMIENMEFCVGLEGKIAESLSSNRSGSVSLQARSVMEVVVKALKEKCK